MLVKRLPLRSCRNLILSKTHSKVLEKYMDNTLESQEANKINFEKRKAVKVVRRKVPDCVSDDNMVKCIKNSNKGDSANVNKKLQVPRKKNITQKTVRGKRLVIEKENMPEMEQLEKPIVIRQSAPLVSRLRNNAKKKYCESSLEESNIKVDLPSVSNEPKVPIYKQLISKEPKENHKDPYEFNITDTVKTKKKINPNNSTKFDKTMHNLLIELEKKEKKKATVKKKNKLKKSSPKYKENVNKAMKRVLEKIQRKKDISGNSKQCSPHKSSEILKSNIKTKDNLESQQVPVTQYVSEDPLGEGFLGFHKADLTSNKTTSLSLPSCSGNVTNSTLFPNSLSIEKKLENCDTPHLISHHPPRINVLSDISLKTNETFNTSVLSKTSLVVDNMEKTQNLHREFQNDSSVLNNHLSIHNDDHFDLNSGNENVFEANDEDFGFGETTETTPVNVNLNERNNQPRRPFPWRFQGVFKRNPHILKIKKNGLPCKQQEMIIDYDFVKRIESLSSKNLNKHHEICPPKSPVQTRILDYIETDKEHPELRSRLSLFDYEEFIADKVPRKILGAIQNKQQMVSTPKKIVRDVIASPNLSIIVADEEDKENKISRVYTRRIIEKNINEDQEVNKEVDLLPSNLEKDTEGNENCNIHLFEDVGIESTDFSIKLPTLKYGSKKNKRQKKYEELDEERKLAKKRRKNMMTKTEEANFEAWAAQINARFEDDDKHELTIE